MLLRDYFEIWSMLMRFSTAAWDFITLNVSTVLWNFVRDFLPQAIEDLVRTTAWTGGYPVPEMMFRDIFGTMTILELFLGVGIPFVLGYKFAIWVLDVFF